MSQVFPRTSLILRPSGNKEKTCPNCKSPHLVTKDGTTTCTDCGHSVTRLQEVDASEFDSYTGKAVKNASDIEINHRDIVALVQDVLILQLETLISDFHCPNSLYTCTFQIWKSYLALASNIKDSKDEAKLEKAVGGIFLMAKEKGSSKKVNLNLGITIVVLFLSCLMLRLPFLSSDFVSWATNGALPFKSAAGKLATTHQKLFRYCFREAQFVPNEVALIRKTLSLAKLLNLTIPPVNAPLVCYRLLSQLSLLALFPHVQKLHKALPEEYFCYTEKNYRQSEAFVVSLIPLSVFLHFSSSGIKIDVAGWMRKYTAHKQESEDDPLKAVFEVTEESLSSGQGGPSANLLHDVFSQIASYSDFTKRTSNSNGQKLVPVDPPSSLPHCGQDEMYKVLLQVCANYIRETPHNIFTNYIRPITTELDVKKAADKRKRRKIIRRNRARALDLDSDTDLDPTPDLGDFNFDRGAHRRKKRSGEKRKRRSTDPEQRDGRLQTPDPSPDLEFNFYRSEPEVQEERGEGEREREEREREREEEERGEGEREEERGKDTEEERVFRKRKRKKNEEGDTEEGETEEGEQQEIHKKRTNNTYGTNGTNGKTNTKNAKSLVLVSKNSQTTNATNEVGGESETNKVSEIAWMKRKGKG